MCSKKVLALLLMLILFFSVGCSNVEKKSAQNEKRMQFINMVTGMTSGVYYPLGSAFAELFNKKIPDVNVNVLSTGGSVANLSLLTTGKADIAIVQSDIAFYALNGIEMYKGKNIENVKAIAPLYSDVVQIIASKKSEIKNISQMKGKRVALSVVGSGAEINSKQILAAYGLSANDIEANYMEINESIVALNNDKLDAIFMVFALLQEDSFSEMFREPVNVVAIDDEKIDLLIKKYPFYEKTVIPKGSFKGQDKDICTVSVNAILIVSDRINEKLGYEMISVIYNNIDKINEVNKIGKVVNKEKMLENISIPFNKGAEKFLAEKKK